MAMYITFDSTKLSNPLPANPAMTQGEWIEFMRTVYKEASGRELSITENPLLEESYAKIPDWQYNPEVKAVIEESLANPEGSVVAIEGNNDAIKDKLRTYWATLPDEPS